MDLRLIIALFCAISFGSAVSQSSEENSVESLEADNTSLFKWKDVSKKKKELQHLIENKVQPLLTDVHTSTLELNSVLADIEQQKAGFENYKRELSENLKSLPQNCLTDDVVFHSNALNKWNFKDCGNFTDDCLYGAKLALNGTIVAFKIGMTTSTIVVSVTDCPSWNVFKAYRCFESNIQATIDLIDFIEKEGVPIIQRAVALAKKLPPDFKKCFGFANQSKLMLYQSLNNAKCFSMI